MLEILALPARGPARRLDRATAERLLAEPDADPVWVDVLAGTDEEFAWLARTFGLHPLEVEDARSYTEVPKLEAYPDHLLLVAHAPRLDEGGELQLPELDLFWGRRWAITVRAVSVAAVEEAWRAALEGRLPGWGPEFVVHAVLDRAAESLLPLLDRLGQAREAVEDELLAAPRPASAPLLLRLRRDLQRLRHSVGPLRFLVERLAREETPLVGSAARPYFRDVADLLHRVHGLIEHELALLAGAYDLHLSRLSHQLAAAAQRTNEIMQRLTAVTSIFLPLSLIAGIYGMNFRYMPELEWRYGYPFALALMGITALAMVAYFRRRGWWG